MKFKSIYFICLILTIESKADSLFDCRNSIFGCCPDGVTPSEGQNYENCPQKTFIQNEDEEEEDFCQSSEFGCCSDNLTPAKGPNQDGCDDQTCQNSVFGCCPDMVTQAKTEDHSDCPDSPRLDTRIRNYSLKSCSLSEYECCPDGLTPANGPNFKDCSEDGSIILIKNLKVDKNICVLPQPESSCFNFTLKWRYDMSQGRCVQFWYGGCDGNDNLFDTDAECESRCISPNGTDICELPAISPTQFSESPLCQQNVTRFYYDIHTSSCKTFSYSGCYGNSNNFETIEECERRCQVPLLFEKCSFIPDKGPCRGDHERWYYDSKVGQCKTFSYGGCMINKNNHLTENDCFNSCVKPKQKNVCLLPKIIGNCDEKIISWYYDYNEGKCKEMSYSGCDGNLNRFETQEACEYTCQGLVDYPKPKIISDICEAPKVSGSCHVYIQRWYYNTTTQMCHQFTFTGCDSSPNNFENEVDCRTTCNAKKIDPCELPMDVGTCDDYKIFWYYNKIDKECSRFYYGGCDGNPNRFQTRETCEMDCKMTPEEKNALLKLPKQCLEPMDYGSNCGVLSPKWYFDPREKTCYPFEYSGCGPEFSNRFDSNQECAFTCGLNETSSYVDNLIRTSTSIVSTSDIHQDICVLPIDEGNCSQQITKWYYDTKLKYCTQFNFTGCNGNENRFENRKQCTEICEIPKKREICYSNKAQGPCDQLQMRWYYDTETQSCQEFQYGGCLGNDNNFPSLFECKNFCWEYLSDDSRQDSYPTTTNLISRTPQFTSASFYDACSLPISEGNCDDRIERWYHDPSTKECKKFVYTGCDGNENNFENKERCLLKCSSGFLNAAVSDYETPCEAPIDISIECLDPVTSEILPSKSNVYESVWFYDIESRSCRSISSECLNSENQNRFQTYDDCKSQCIPNVSDKQTEDDCLLPFDTGDKCTLQIWRWYYDSKSGHCELFSYSGCHGNNNNFPTNKDCMWLCAAVGASKCPSLDECELNCPYGRVISKKNCELCQCFDPCENHSCDYDHQCAVVNSLPTCRPKNKPGMCPQPSLHKDLNCENNCRTDADCDSDLKCCMNGCSSYQCTKANFDKDPVIEEFKIQVILNEGETLELPCKASGYPIPTITWFKRTEEITFDSKNNRITLSKQNSLIIRNVTEIDEAVYSCRASNQNGKAVLKESTVIINVDGEISHGSYDKHVLIGNDAFLNCNLTGRPYPKSQWFFNGSMTPIKQDPFKYTIYPSMLLIKRFNKYDIGTYSCRLEKKTKKNSEINVNLYEAIPGEVKLSFTLTNGDENTSAVLRCEVVGEPKPIVTWHNPLFKPIQNNTDKYEIINGGDLKINMLKQSDAGVYRCYAHNQFSNSYMRKKYGSVMLHVYSRPMIVNNPEFKQENASESVMMNCIATGLPKPGINWYQNDKIIVINSTIDPKFGNKFKYFVNNGSLLINNLETLDSGTYYCQAISLNKYKPATLNHTLKVISSKVEIVKTHSISAVETETIKLNCLINDFDSKIITIEWTLNDNTKFNSNNPRIKSSDDFTILTIKKSKISDSGMYICKAHTDSTVYTTRINLEINFKNIQIESKTKFIRTEINRPISLDCAWWLTNSENMFDSSTEYSIEWKLNSSSIDVYSNKQKYEFLDNFKTLLEVKDIQLKDSHDTYSCILKMSDQTEKQSVFKLIIGVPPYINHLKTNKISKWYKRYDQVYLECDFEGVPKPKVSWFFNENEINFDSRILKIDDTSLTLFQLDDTQQGLYSCNGSNDFGSKRIDYSVEIAKPIRIKEIFEKVLRVKKYDSITLKCDYSSGKPEPNVTWYFNWSIISIDNFKYFKNGNKLTIKDLNDNDNGLFMCVLSNGFFEDRSITFNINIYERIAIKIYPDSPVFTFGTDGKLSCLVENGVSKTDINWFRNDVMLNNGLKYSIDGGNLIVRSVKNNDSGKYTCSVGQVNQSIDVKVIDKTRKIECEDKSSYNNCKLVVARGLCNKFSKYCCKTCRQAGYDSKSN